MNAKCVFRRVPDRATSKRLLTIAATTSDRFAPLRELLPHVEFSTNPYELSRHGHGESYHPTREPDIIALPRTTNDVREIIKFCVRQRIPVVPFGAGTSVEGHVCALQGGLSLDMNKFQTLELPDKEGDHLPDPIATVGPGVTRKQLNEALRHTGLQFVVDPGADASLGGMVSTGASGTTTIQYGTIRENILALEVVLPDQDATVVKLGTKALKNSAGYDLLSLMCGSEGTLGVITSVTVKLRPIPDHVVAAVCAFDTLKHAAQAVATLKLSQVPLSRCELLDESSVAACNAYNKHNQPMDVKPTLFLEFQGNTEDSLHQVVQMTQSICVDEFGGSNFQFAVDEAKRKALWSARHSLYHATIHFREGAHSAVTTDACVPLSKFADVIDETAADVKAKGIVGPCFGHAGDGNLHCIMPVRHDDTEEYWSKIESVNENLIARTLAAGGTCTGEHGVGHGKIRFLERQYGPGAVQMMKIIKKALDPYNIMNPGKVVIV